MSITNGQMFRMVFGVDFEWKFTASQHTKEWLNSEYNPRNTCMDRTYTSDEKGNFKLVSGGGFGRPFTLTSNGGKNGNHHVCFRALA